MRLFKLFKKKGVNAQPAQKQGEGNNTSFANTEPTVAERTPAEKAWVDRGYMSGLDLGKIEGYTDLVNEPKSTEEGVTNELKWKRYENIIIITGTTNTDIKIIEIPQRINGYKVAGIERMAFMDCQVQSITVPHTIEYIGFMAFGFYERSVFSDEEEREIRACQPFYETFPPLDCKPSFCMRNKSFFLYNSPKTIVIGSKGTTAEDYTKMHHLPFKQNVSDNNSD